jgi:Predicted membrane protein
LRLLNWNMANKIQIPGKLEKIIVEICRYLLAGVFLFSGYVKAVDPWGVVYKNLDYFEALGLTFFNFSAIPFAFFLFALEFALGICLLLGIYRRFSSVLILLFMLFMTPFTLYLAITNPVTDCGCFGEAWVITNWQTFSKNVVLLLAALIVFLRYKRMTPFFSRKSESLALLWSGIFILGFSFYCFLYLPTLDFRPYKKGAYLPELMEIPDDAEMDIYETTLVYSKDGKTEEFTIENYPKNDPSWTFVDSRNKLIKKGYEPPIHDFVILTEDGDEITDLVLENPSYTFLLIAHKLEKTSDSNVDKINEIYDYARDYGYDFFALTSSLPNTIREWKENTGAEYPFCSMDDITLKTIIRSNPGLVLLKEGTVINKWANRKLPDSNQLDQPLEDSTLGQIPPDHSVRSILISGLILFLPLIALWLFDFFRYKRSRVARNHIK